MRIFQTAKEMVNEVERDLAEMGTLNEAESVQDKIVKGDKQYDTLELIGYSYCLRNFYDLDFLLEKFKIPSEYCIVELADRLSKDILNPGNAYKFRKNIWDEFLHDGKFAYTYNERMNERIWGLDNIINQLLAFPNTRQGIISIFNPSLDYKNMGAISRIPCSMYYQVLRRNNKLSLIYTMRSCDFYTHFAVDVWLAIMLLKYLAGRLCLPEGEFIHFIGSLHAFRKDMKGIF
jgi:thymidylate synthase